MAKKHFTIRKLNITFVFRHKWEKHDDAVMDYRVVSMFRTWRLGFWFEPTKILGKKMMKDSNTLLVNSYTLGVDLLVCKAWIHWSINGLYLRED